MDINQILWLVVCHAWMVWVKERIFFYLKMSTSVVSLGTMVCWNEIRIGRRMHVEYVDIFLNVPSPSFKLVKRLLLSHWQSRWIYMFVKIWSSSLMHTIHLHYYYYYYLHFETEVSFYLVWQTYIHFTKEVNIFVFKLVLTLQENLFNSCYKVIFFGVWALIWEKMTTSFVRWIYISVKQNRNSPQPLPFSVADLFISKS